MGEKIKIVVDTNVLMSESEKLLKDIDGELLVCATVIEELDHLKTSDNSKKAFKARQGIKYLKNNRDKYRFVLNGDIKSKELLNGDFDTNKNDNKILDVCLREKANLFTLDFNMVLKAEVLGIDVINVKEEEEYKGYREITGNTEYINKILENYTDDKNNNILNLLENEYLIVQNTDTGKLIENRYSKGKLERLKLPPSKIVKGVNSKQRCALDLLYNTNIPIKLICGNFGSGKSLLSVKTSIHLVKDKELFNTVLFVRNPIPAGEIDIGFLPGEKESKIGQYFKPMFQYIDDEKQIEGMQSYEQIKTEIVSFMKGLSVDKTIMLVDEAEDLNVKLLKLLGTRIGKDSMCIFCGDYRQAENRYRNNNGLELLIKETKGNPLVGIIVMDEDVRSEASKVFAEL